MKHVSARPAKVSRTGEKAHQRFIRAKGIVCKGTFQASPDASAISRAAHLRGARVPVTVRFSDGAPDITVPDNSPDAAPRGMAIRLESGRGTDIMAISRNGFLVGAGEEFLALLQAQTATDRSKPHPWPIEAFLGSHPRALKFVQDPKPVPVSFATASFYSNKAFMFVNSEGLKQAGRYQIVPIGGGRSTWTTRPRRPSRPVSSAKSCVLGSRKLPPGLA